MKANINILRSYKVNLELDEEEAWAVERALREHAGITTAANLNPFTKEATSESIRDIHSTLHEQLEYAERENQK